jgi:hypothetical protein
LVTILYGIALIIFNLAMDKRHESIASDSFFKGKRSYRNISTSRNINKKGRNEMLTNRRINDMNILNGI